MTDSRVPLVKEWLKEALGKTRATVNPGVGKSAEVFREEQFDIMAQRFCVAMGKSGFTLMNWNFDAQGE